jgi:hypothetical protein
VSDWIEQHVRASSIKDALDCAMRFEAKHILGIRIAGNGVSHLGTALHAGTGAYDQSVIDGKPISHDEAVGRFVDSLRLPNNPEEPAEDEVRWDEEFPLTDAEKVGVRGVVNYIEKVGSLRRYHAVEAKLEKFPVRFDKHKVVIVLTGKTDRIREKLKRDGVGYGITDVKSGKTRVTKDSRVSSRAEKAQLGVYELIAEKGKNIQITEPAEIAGISTAQHANVATLEIPGTREALVGTGETPGVLDFLAKMLRTGLFPPNPSSFLCGKRFCPIYSRCPYHDE